VDGRIVALLEFDDGSGPALHAAGTFHSAGGAFAHGIARWDGTHGANLSSGLPGPPLCLAGFDDGGGPALHAGGELFVARREGATWVRIGTPGGPTFARAQALAVFDDGGGPALYAGGRFTSMDGVPERHLVRWNGSSWSALPGGDPNDRVYAHTVFNDGGGPALYAAGWFVLAGGTAVGHVGRWDGTGWTALDRGVNFPANALAVFDDGSGPALYAAGEFTLASSTPVGRIARWNGASWEALGSGVNDVVHVLAAFDDGTGPALHAGGDFTMAGGVAASRIARWNGSRWRPLGSGVSSRVSALAVFDAGPGPALFVGGGFWTAPDSGDSTLARWACALREPKAVPR
jgi:hypothetical protein